MTFDRSSVEVALRECGSIAAASRMLGIERRRLSEFVNADPELRALASLCACTTSARKGQNGRPSS